MPVFESACPAGHVFEWYASMASKPDPPCRFCGEPTKRLISRFHAIYTGSIGRYNDPTKEFANERRDGHTAWRHRSTRNPDGSPEAVRITNRAEQLAYCREEGVEDPAGMNSNTEVSSDGMSLQTAGVKGQWI